MSITLQLHKVGVKFGSRQVLQDITAEFRGGELISVIGQNGGGKTTLLKAIADLIPFTGNIVMSNGDKGKPGVAYVPQLTQVASRLTVFEMVLLGLVKELSWKVSKAVFERVDQTLHALNIDHLASLPVCSLSGGQKQLVFMAQAFVSNPGVLLLDEPTSALDLRHQLVVMNAARAYTRQHSAVTLVIVHDLLTAARFSDKLLLIGNGTVRCFDDPKRVLEPEVISEVYRVSVSVETTKPGFLSVIPLEPL